MRIYEAEATITIPVDHLFAKEVAQQKVGTISVVINGITQRFIFEEARLKYDLSREGQVVMEFIGWKEVDDA